MILKLERFSHLSGQSFGLGYPIVLKALSCGHSVRESKRWRLGGNSNNAGLTVLCCCCVRVVPWWQQYLLTLAKVSF